MATSKLRERLEAEARALGFAAIGIAPADAAPRTAERLRAWLEEGAHGDMIWMADTAERRGSPGRALAAGALRDLAGHELRPRPRPACFGGEPDIGRISVYAQGADYHDTVKRALKALARWLVAEAGCELKVFVDTAPVMEKPLAAAAGLGWQGKHTNLVSRRDGSWLFLGAIYTTLDLADEALPADDPHPVIAAPAPPAWTLAPPTLFRRRSGSMPAAAFPILRSSIRARSRTNSGRRSATASMAATIACPFARGTASPMPRAATRHSCPAPSSPHRRSPTCSR
jgi:hypothetical protein